MLTYVRNNDILASRSHKRSVCLVNAASANPLSAFGAQRQDLPVLEITQFAVLHFNRLFPINARDVSLGLYTDKAATRFVVLAFARDGEDHTQSCTC
jgi:hypothetical protein